MISHCVTITKINKRLGMLKYPEMFIRSWCVSFCSSCVDCGDIQVCVCVCVQQSYSIHLSDACCTVLWMHTSISWKAKRLHHNLTSSVQFFLNLLKLSSGFCIFSCKNIMTLFSSHFSIMFIKDLVFAAMITVTLFCTFCHWDKLIWIIR